MVWDRVTDKRRENRWERVMENTRERSTRKSARDRERRLLLLQEGEESSDRRKTNGTPVQVVWTGNPSVLPMLRRPRNISVCRNLHVFGLIAPCDWLLRAVWGWVWNCRWNRSANGGVIDRR